MEIDFEKVKKVLFDLDGTLSLERDGWIDIMIGMFADELVKHGVDDAVSWSIGCVKDSIGIPTYRQMEMLARKIGSNAKNPSVYKRKYTAELDKLVKIRRRTLPNKELVVKGSFEFLEYCLDKFGKKDLYLASGTDNGPVLNSAIYLGFEKYFFYNRIVGAGIKNPRDCAKELIIERMVEEHGLSQGELLVVGDGAREIKCGKKYGYCVGVLTEDVSKYDFSLSEKWERLVDAGADVIVDDLSDLVSAQSVE